MRMLAASALALALSSPAVADGLLSGSSSVKDPIGRPVQCYFGIYGQGDWTRQSQDIATFGTLANAADWGTAVGPRIGCDYVRNAIMVGLFADYSFRLSNSRTSMLGLMTAPEIGDQWSVGGRVGVSPITGSFLYALAGYAGADEGRGTLGGAPISFGNLRGLALGGGIETQLLPFATVGVEYRHVAYDDGKTAMVGGIIPVTPTNRDNDSVRLGLNFKF